MNTDAQVSDNYTFETIDVEGVEFLALAASSDFEDYAGYTKSDDGEKNVAFTLIDGVFTTHDFPGSKGTYFFALGNNGVAAGHYEDSDGLYHGVILENGELIPYNFPNSVQTEIYGYSDSTGALTGNFTDASGIRRGFSGDTIVEFPGASETYADFVSGLGNVVGSYVDTEGTYHAYLRGPGGSFATLDIPDIPNMEYFFSPRYQRCPACRWQSEIGGWCPAHLCRQPPQATRISGSGRRWHGRLEYQSGWFCRRTLYLSRWTYTRIYRQTRTGDPCATTS